MTDRSKLRIRSLACAAPALALASPLNAAVLLDTNGFEPTGSPETYTNGPTGTNLAGQNGWVSFNGASSIRVSDSRTINGSASVRSGTDGQTRAAARAITVTPDADPSLITDLIISGTIGNDTDDDNGFGDIALTTSTGGFDLLRLRRNGGGESFQAFAADSLGVEAAGDTFAAADANGTAYEYEITLRYNPGTDDDQARVLVREIGDTDWNAISSVAGATLDGDDFANLGYDADTGTLYLALQANQLSGGFRTAVRIDDLVVSTATTVIPEPASLALLGAGALCLLGRRRRA